MKRTLLELWTDTGPSTELALFYLSPPPVTSLLDLCSLCLLPSLISHSLLSTLFLSPHKAGRKRKASKVNGILRSVSSKWVQPVSGKGHFKSRDKIHR